jgi:hypothetical protein
VKNLYLSTIILMVGLTSCKLDPNWDIDGLAPIAQTTLTPGNLIPVGDVTPDSTGKLHYVYDGTVYTVPLDSLFKIPDTTYSYGFTAPISFIVQPGTEAPVFDGYISPSVNQAVLTELVVISGGIRIKASSFTPRPLILRFQIPKASKNGQPFSMTKGLEAAAAGGSVQFEQYIDLSGYHLDLTGDDGTIGNRLRMAITATIDPTSSVFPVDAGFQLVNCDIKLDAVKPYYAKGTISTQELAVESDTLKLGVLDMIKSGSINLEDITMKLSVENGLGLDLQAIIYKIAGKNGYNGNDVFLTHPSINNAININRAQANLYQVPEYTPATKEVLFNAGNSNLKAFIENLPSKVSIDGKFIINPFGNVSGGNDFLFYNSKTALKLKIDAPLAFAINDLVLLDTVSLNINMGKNQPVKSATLKAYVKNGFPFQGDLQVYFPGNNNVVDSIMFQQTIQSAIVGSNLKVVSPVESVLEAMAEGPRLDQLLASKKIWFRVKLATNPSGQVISIYDGYKMDVQLTAQVKYNL